ncbi:MAG: zf-TFIIB domain-containing protein [Planctomycetota bacterium]
MDCPRCELGLAKTDYEGVAVDMCNECLGVWLDNGELQLILDLDRFQFSAAEKAALLDPNRHLRPGPTEPAACPRCGETMRQQHYDAAVHLIIDQCRKHGVWLDTGEIKQVQAISEQSQAIHRMLLQKLGLL